MTFLPPDPKALFPSHQPDNRALREFQDNPLALEWLSRVYRKLHYLQGHLHQSADMNALTKTQGYIEGMTEPLRILDTIENEIKNGSSEIRADSSIAQEE